MWQKKHTVSELRDNVMWPAGCAIGVSEEEKTKKTDEEIVAKTFPDLMETVKTQIQEAR